MKSIVIHAAHDLRVEDQVAESPGTGQLGLRLATGGVCGSDLHYYNHGGFGSVRLREPMVLGHEVSAYVDAIGPGVSGFSVGQLVAVSPSRPCNTCRYCLGSLSPTAAKQGVTDLHIAELEHRPPGLFTDKELAAFDLAEALWTNAAAAGADTALRQRLREHFSDAELLELVWAAGMYIGLGKMIVFFGIERDD